MFYNRFIMKEEGRKYMLIVLGIFAVWLIGSTYIYTCNIKGFCRKQNQNQEIVKSNFVEKNDKNVIREKIVKKEVPVETTKKIVKVKKKTIKCLTYLNSNIRLNSKNNFPSEVRKLEEFLNKYYNANLEVNGIYESQDAEALKEFQKEQNLDQDGILGPHTREVLNAYYCIQNQNK